MKSNCIAIFDQTYGSLRLTERCYTDFATLIERIGIAARAETDPNEHLAATIMYEELKKFESSLEDNDYGGSKVSLSGDDSVIQIFAPGSRVSLRQQGAYFTEIEIVGAALIPPEDTFMYQVKFEGQRPGAPVTRWVNPEFVEPTSASDEWSYARWDRYSQSYIADEEEI